MKINLIVGFLLILVSCNNTVISHNDDMNNTIKSGDKLKIEKVLDLTRNDIVGFKIPESGEQKILRIVGLPGDTLVIDSSRIYVNGKLFNLPPSEKKIYLVYCKDPKDFEKLTSYDFSVYSLNYSFFSLDKKEFNEMRNKRIADSIYPIYLNRAEVNNKIIQNSTSRYKNKDFFGPIFIPRKKEIITSDIVNIIPNFLTPNDLNKIIDDEYYFCIGDNFAQSIDSRELGLIPKKAIQWKVNLEQQ